MPEAKINPKGIGGSMNIFSGKTVYQIGWELVNSRKFTQEEIEAVAGAEVVPSQYGKSVKFALKRGGCVYIPVSRDSAVSTGQTVDLQTAKILTLSKPGEDDIERIEI